MFQGLGFRASELVGFPDFGVWGSYALGFRVYAVSGGVNVGTSMGVCIGNPNPKPKP